ncbi:non-homologous end joining protein Ku [Gracilibacillus alcaliphilus]|uniref:non-homologous end joining protein Ku n=1 Tax=Gracilibacillus alcaliphilus TaxID=1401441 RepID=UPI001956A6EF|nr:Ku protein [Gracilibacillus alcaliphilus]MBM7679747.1 DNA end-binding protein Ku [Gracilibacillus alcaliphilus]
MHTMWKGTISFGLVNIPVKMHAATENKDIKLRQLHKKCKTPIKYEKTCPNCEEEVKNEDIVKAYEYASNKFVVLDDEELEALKKEQEDKAVEIIDFVQLEEIDPIYFEKSYYLSPNEGGTKAYALLREALTDTGKIGIAKMMIRSKEQLAIIRVYKDAIVVETIHYPDEVRAVGDVPNVPSQESVNAKELDTAKLLIDQLTTEFEPEKYKDDYRTALMEFIEAKKNNEEIEIGGEPKSKPDNVVNLMDALQESLNRAKSEKPKTTKPKKKTTTKKKATTTKTGAKKKKATS